MPKMDSFNKYLKVAGRAYMLTVSVFSKTRLLPELRWVLSCELAAVSLHFPLVRNSGLGPLLSAPAGASKRETPTSNLTESTDCIAVFSCITWDPCVP